MCSKKQLQLVEFISKNDYDAMINQKLDLLDALTILSKTPSSYSHKDNCVVCRKMICMDRLCKDRLHEDRICVDCLIKEMNLGYVPDFK